MTSLARLAGLFALGAVLVSGGEVAAQPVDVPATWGGDFASRPRLTGDWNGLRDELGKKGVVLDVDLLLTPQVVASGGRDTGAQFWGNVEYMLNVDTDKLGLWPGGFLRVSAISGFGHSAIETAAVVPVNTAALLPVPDEEAAGLTNATFMQFLSPQIGFLAGKVFTLDANPGEFAGNFRTQFMNTALAIPMSLALVPLSAYGGGVVGLPHKDVVLTAMVLDPRGTITDDDLSDALDDGVMVIGSGHLTIEPFGLRGHQGAGFMWSNADRLSLVQDPSNLARLLLTERFPRLGNPGPLLERFLERFFPELLEPTFPPNREEDTWAMFYNFDQYLWSPGADRQRGVGVFFTFGAADAKTNPVAYSYVVGVGGKGLLPARPRDSAGIGWARTEISGEFIPFLRQRLDLGLDREDAVEMYYNAALTAWLDLTLDLQIVDSGLEKKLADTGRRLESIDTAVVLGMRLYARF